MKHLLIVVQKAQKALANQLAEQLGYDTDEGGTFSTVNEYGADGNDKASYSHNIVSLGVTDETATAAVEHAATIDGIDVRVSDQSFILSDIAIEYGVEPIIRLNQEDFLS